MAMNSIVPSANPRDRGLPNFADTGNQKLIEEQKRKLQDEKTKNEKLQKEIENLKRSQEEMHQQYQKLHYEHQIQINKLKSTESKLKK